MTDYIVRAKGVVHPVYTRQEADDLKLPYIHWKAVIGGEWALTDDGYVLQCRSRQVYPASNGETVIINFFGSYYAFVRPNTIFNWQDRLQNGSARGAGLTSFITKQTSHKKVKEIIHAYAVMRLQGEVKWDILANMLQPNYPLAEARLKRLLKTQKAKKMIKEELEALLSTAGITRATVIEDLKEARRMALASNDSRKVMEVTKALMDLTDLKPESSPVPQSGLPDMAAFAAIIDGHREARAALTQFTDVTVEESKAPDVP